MLSRTHHPPAGDGNNRCQPGAWPRLFAQNDAVDRQSDLAPFATEVSGRQVRLPSGLGGESCRPWATRRTCLPRIHGWTERSGLVF